MWTGAATARIYPRGGGGASVVASPSMPVPRPVAAALAAALAAGTAAARDADERGPDVVALRFAWSDPLELRVVYRRTRIRTGKPRETFTARFTSRATREGAVLRLATTGTAWEGDLPIPPGFAAQAIRASERVVGIVDGEGAFERLEGTEAMRAVLAKIYGLAKVPREKAERAMNLAEAAMRAEAEELWNLEVGFWTDAELEVGETYALRAEAEIALLPGARAEHEITFSARRRVPCAAGERRAGCVELTLRSEPSPAALRRAAPRLARELAGKDAPAPAPGTETAAEAELVLVTDPSTLVPRRLVWTKTARIGAGEDEREEVDRAEYEWRPAPAPDAKRPVKGARAPEFGYLPRSGCPSDSSRT